MKNNGSPIPSFETDDDRTWFRVTLPLHPAFAKANKNQQLGKIDDDQIRLADLVTDLVTNKRSNKGFARILLLLYNAELTRGEIFKHLKLSNQTLNYKNYLEPLEKVGLIEKTFPGKPNNPQQKYKLTHKGRLLVEEVSD